MPVLQAIQDLFLTGNTDPAARVVHRLALFNDLGNITQLVSQMDVIR